MERLECGVLFCGGCNTKYDRGALYQEVRSILEKEGISFSYYEKERKWDFVLLINGCESECLLGSDYSYTCPVVLVREGNLDKAVADVRACAARLRQTPANS